MANPPPILTEDRLQAMIDAAIQKAIARHELRFSLYGVPMILLIVLAMAWLS